MKSTLLIAWVLLLAWAGRAFAVEFSSIEFAGAHFTVCRVDVRRERLQLLLRDDSGQPFKRFDRLAVWAESHGRKLVFAMNAGMFHADFGPVGLFVADAQALAPLNLADGEGNFFLKPNGVFAVTERGARVVESAEFSGLSERVSFATQSGPLLVRGGQLHPAFKPGSESRLIRNGVGVSSSGAALFVISDVPVNFHEFATLFRDALHCPDALYLDGAVSSLHAPALKRSDAQADLGPIFAVTE